MTASHHHFADHEIRSQISRRKKYLKVNYWGTRKYILVHYSPALDYVIDLKETWVFVEYVSKFKSIKSPTKLSC